MAKKTHIVGKKGRLDYFIWEPSDEIVARVRRIFERLGRLDSDIKPQGSCEGDGPSHDPLHNNSSANKRRTTRPSL